MKAQIEGTRAEHARHELSIVRAGQLLHERLPMRREFKPRRVLQRQTVMGLLTVTALLAEDFLESLGGGQGFTQRRVTFIGQQARRIGPRVGMLLLERLGIHARQRLEIQIAHYVLLPLCLVDEQVTYPAVTVMVLSRSRWHQDAAGRGVRKRRHSAAGTRLASGERIRCRYAPVPSWRRACQHSSTQRSVMTRDSASGTWR